MTSRLHATAFALLCALGIVAAVGLAVREITRTTPIALTVEHTARVGASTLVTVSIHNRTDAVRCVTLRVAARDRAGHDLATAAARPSVTLPGHARRTVQVRLTLTPRQYAEQLDAFYPSQRPCAAAAGEG